MRLVDAEFEERHYISMVDNPTPDVSENDKRTALAIARAFQMAKTVEPEAWITEVREAYDRALKNAYIRKPLSCALYEVWHRYDAREVER
jgi:hypothetical protein